MAADHAEAASAADTAVDLAVASEEDPISEDLTDRIITVAGTTTEVGTTDIITTAEADVLADFSAC